MADHPTTGPDRQPTTASDHPTTTGRSTSADRLRLIPPVAALGTAWVMQVVAVTDTVGEALAKALVGSPMRWLADHSGIGYLFALLLGVAVASCAEGGAAYLMDLYDKHLLARDSTWPLRVGMVAYVCISAGAIHWWTHHRGLPDITSWLLAGMSASALFLWSRGSRWRNRVAMRAAGQLDPALPKLPAAAKFWHPIRSLNTVRLVSWEPVATTDEARARYEEWHQARAARKNVPKPTGRKPVESTTAKPSRPAALPGESPVDEQPTAARPAAKKPAAPKPNGRPPMRLVYGPTVIADAAFLRETYGDDQSADHFPGRNELMRRHGGNAGKWSAALKAHADRADRQPAARSEPAGDSDDAEERVG